MKKTISFLFVLGLFIISSYAQVATYTFTQATHTYDTLANGKILGSATTAAGTYFTDSTVVAGSTTATTGIGLPIGFNFTYNATVFNLFGVNLDGWISFGQSALTPNHVDMNSNPVNAPISATSTAPAALQNRVSAFGRGIVAQAISKLSYATVGTAPNRTLVVEWKNFRRSSNGSVDTLNFQIKLHETTNTIEYVYGKMKVSTNSAGQVGLRGTANTDFNNRTSTIDWSATTAGAANNASITISNTILPVSGLTFIWAPPVYYADDAGLTAINAPATPVTIGNNNVTVTIKNFGTDSLKTASIGWKVNNVVQTSYPFNNTGLPPFATNGPVTIGSYNFSTAGFYVIKAWTSLPNGNPDGNNTNDTLIKTVYAQGYAPIPFIETFDNPWINKNDTSDVPSLYWANTPAFGNNSWRRNDNGLSGNWTQADSAAYTPPGANSTLNSARFHTWSANNGQFGTMDLYVNLNPTGGKLLDFWNINVDGTDSLSIYLSTDGGATFSFIKKFQTATVWAHNIIPIGSSTSSTCVVRFKAVSDYGNTDLGIDQVQVYLVPGNDMAAVKWGSPNSGCGLSNAEHVSVKVANAGLTAQSNIPVKYSIDGGATYVGPETIAGPVNPGDTVTYTFAASSNFAAMGTYNCRFVVANSGDAITSNDTINLIINSLVTISGNPFVDSLEAGNKYYILSNSTNSAVALSAGAGNNASTGFDMTGGVAGTWPSGSSTTTTGPQAFSYTDHVARIRTCSVDASAFPANQMFLKFDLKQTHSTTGTKYSYFMVLVNGTDTVSDISGAKFFNPATGNADPFAAKFFNLGAYAGQTFSLEFVSACKYNDASQTPADHAYVDNIVLYVPPVINDLGPDTVICQGSNVTFDAGPGTGYTYLWTQQPGGIQVGTSQTITVTASGTYQVVVTNSLGLTAADAVTVTVNPPPAANAGLDTTVTYLAAATLHGTVGAPGNYSYTWLPADSLVNANVQNPTTVAMHNSTIFTVYVTDLTSGCVGNDQVTVFVTGGPLSVTAHASPDTICSGEVVSLSALPSGGSGTYTYSWTSVPAGFTSTGVTTTDTPTANIVYNLNINDGTNTATSSVAVIVHPSPIVNLGNDTTLCTTSTITLNAGTGGTNYLWSNGTIGQYVTVDSTMAVGGVANISVTVTNSNGCSTTDNIAITYVNCTGVDEYGNNASMALYPNPTTGLTNILVNGISTEANIEVFSLEGQLVYSGIIANNKLVSIDLTNLPKGVYAIRILNEKNSLIRRLIIQ